MTEARSSRPLQGGPTEPDVGPATPQGQVRPGEVRPGDVRPGGVRPPSPRRLQRAPGDRYASGGVEAAGPPRWDRALLFGLGAAILGALAWLIAGGVIELTGGLVVLAAVAGWGIGAAVCRGAWAGRPHEPDGRARALAVLLAGATWLAGTFLVYLYSQATLPESALSLGERLAATPFPDWVAPQLLPLAPVELVALVLVGWYAAR